MARFVQLLLGVCAWCARSGRGELNVVYQWDKLDLSLRPEDSGAGSYIPENNVAYRMKIWNDTLFVAIPRFRRGVPATLCKSQDGVMRPFPSLGLQAVGNCFGMQNVRDLELDHLGQLWTLDVGRVHDVDATTKADATCRPKLFVMDANTGRLVRSAVLPAAAWSARSQLSGLAIDLKTLTAVVADLDAADPGFVVYNLAAGVFRRYRCSALSAAAPPDPAGGARPSPSAAGYDEAQLVVSPIDNMLYFTTVRLDSLYALPLSVFDAPLIVDVSHHVHDLGPKTDTSTAMALDTGGNLYMAMTMKVMAWNTVRHGFGVRELFVRDVRLDWVSSFAFDGNGYMWIVSAAFGQFLDGSNARPVNVKIFKRYCGTTSFALQAVAERLADAPPPGAGANATAASSAAVIRSATAATAAAAAVSLLLIQFARADFGQRFGPIDIF